MASAAGPCRASWANSLADVAQGDLGMAAFLQDLFHPGEVLVGVGGVDAEEIMVVVEPVEGDIIHHAAVGVAHGAVLDLAIDQLRGIVDGEFLDESRERPSP